MSGNDAQPSEETPSERPLVEWSVHLFLVACWVLIVALTLLGFAPRVAGDWQPTKRVGLLLPVAPGGGAD